MVDALRFVLAGLAAAAFFYFVFLRRLCVDTVPRNLQVYEALRSPTVRDAQNALEQRVALAEREAGHGSRECTACGFENATRGTSSCVLCGVALAPVKNGSTLFGSSSGRSKAKRGDDASPASESNRQQRVRRRREWTRRATADGNVEWVHDEQLQDPSLADFPVFVLQASLAQPPETAFSSASTSPTQNEVSAEKSTIADGVPDGEESDHVAISVAPASEADPEPVNTETSVAQVARRLTSTLTTMAVRVVDVHQSDAARVAYASQQVGPANGFNATRDFPSKLVQFIKSVATLLRDKNDGAIPSIVRFHIARGDVWADSIAAVATMGTSEARDPVRVDFIGEPGIDAGALYREWVSVLNKTMTSPEIGVFTCVDAHEQTFYLNAQSHDMLGDDHLAHVLAAGRLLGRALLDGNVTGFHLALPLLKIVLGLPVGFGDLEYYDAEAYKSLRWLVENDGVDTLGLDFTIVEKLPSGEARVVELVPGGADVDVTDANKLEYIERKLKYLLFESVESQLFAFLTGVYEVVPAELLTPFDAEELGYLLSGSDEIDVDDWESHTIAFVDEGRGNTGKQLSMLPCYGNFWKVVRALSAEERRRLLQFATGSTRPPPGGFASLTSYDGRLSLFTLRGVPVEETRGYLQSHACFNRLDLPSYWGFNDMRKAVQAAISINEDGFTIA